jgi:hypothetical protein
MTKEPIKRVTRTTRVPLANRGPQTISGIKDPDFVYRFVNDTGSRLHTMQRAGYEFVEDTEMVVGSSRVSDASDLGSRKSVISNDGTTSYLMRIKKEFYEEDQAAKGNVIDEQEGAMKKPQTQGLHGKISIT